MATITQKIGEKIKKLRKKSGLTQEQLAEKAKLDLTTVNEIEAGGRNPSLKTLRKISLALKTKISEIL